MRRRGRDKEEAGLGQRGGKGEVVFRQKQSRVKAERSCRLDSEELRQTVTETLSLNGARIFSLSMAHHLGQLPI